MRDDLALIAQADLRIAQRQAAGDEDLTLDHVVAGHFLGDGVLDLDARIDLDEVEGAAVGIDEELDGAGVVQAHGPADGQGGVEDALPQGRIEVQRRRDLDDLLMAALQRAIALEEVDEIAVLVAEQLHFDVTGAGDVFFQENIGDAEGGAGLAAGLVERIVELVGAGGDAHAASAAAHRRLDHHREAQLRRQLMGLLVGLDGRAAGQDRHVGLLSDVAGHDLVAELFEDLDARADEDDAGLFAGAGEVGVLGQKAVARMNGIDFVLREPGRQCPRCRDRRGSARPVCRCDRLRRP